MDFNDLVNGASKKGESLAGMSIETFLSSLLVAIVIFGVQLALFILIRTQIKKLYEPRTYLVPPQLRVTPPGSGLLDWLPATIKYNIEDVIDQSGLDAYFFLRFMRMILWIFAASCLIIVPILVPINATGHTEDMVSEPSGMDNLSWSNIGPYKTSRYTAHLILAIGLTIVLTALFTYELNVYVEKRQEYLTRPTHKMRATATTILIKYVPPYLRSEEAIKKLFDPLGEVKNVWFTRDYSKLTKLLSEQKKRYRKLEKLITKGIKKSKKMAHDENDDLVEIPKPTLRLPVSIWGKKIKVPFFGAKTDAIDWHCEEIERLTEEITKMKSKRLDFDIMPTCMIQFATQLDAHVACQSVSCHNPNYMDTRLVETDHRDIIWSNMRGSYYEEKLRFSVATALNIVLIIGWAIPVSVVGFISQISYLTELLPFLDFLNDLPDAVKGAISGILPPALLGLLLLLVPTLLTLLAYLKGISTGIRVQLDVQKYYFAFQYIQLFLVITISSGLTTTIQQIIDTPTSTPTILATNLPKAANFFMSYLILQGMITSMLNMLRIDELIFHVLYLVFPPSTAHGRFSQLSSISQIIWGNTFPTYTNLATIGIIYSIISPIVLIFCLISFSLTFIAFKYRIIYCNVNRVHSYGLFFPTAIYQLFTGIYTLQLCLIGLFFLVKDDKNKFACTAHAIIMIVVLVFTALYHMNLKQKMKSVLEFLPIDLAGEEKSSAKQAEMETETPENGTPENVTLENETLENIETLEPDHLENPFSPSTSATSARPNVKKGALHTLTKLGKLVYNGTDDHHMSASHFMHQGIFDQLNTDLESISPQDRERILNHAFLHESLRTPDYVCWIPEDELGAGIREISRIRQQYPLVKLSNDACFLDNRKIMFTKVPPDYDQIKNMRL